MAGAPQGICANCELHQGGVGEPCPEPGCARKGYAYIPRAWFDAAKAFAARRQRPMDPLLGRAIDRYLLAGKLGEGGMGAVYLGIQRPLNREVALKVISGMEVTPATVGRFEREARAISALDHPNIVKLYDYGISNLEFQVPYMALEYVRHGRTLRHALATLGQETAGRISSQVVLTVFQQVLHALGAAHDLGIVHRDMKPDNVMLAPVRGNPYFVKVLDFGLAKAVVDVSGFDGTMSRTGQFLGTPCYMAPEQALAKGRAEVDCRADLYAVAVMIFEVFAGVRPYEGETPLEVVAKKFDKNYRPLDFPEAVALPRPLRQFLATGMEADAAARFQSATEMLEGFELALSGRTTTAVGLQAKAASSTHDRPATPASPAVEVEVPPTPTARLGVPTPDSGSVDAPEAEDDGDPAAPADGAASAFAPRGRLWHLWWGLVVGGLIVGGFLAALLLVSHSAPTTQAPAPVETAAPAAVPPAATPAPVEGPGVAGQAATEAAAEAAPEAPREPPPAVQAAVEPPRARVNPPVPSAPPPAVHRDKPPSVPAKPVKKATPTPQKQDKAKGYNMLD